MTPVRDCDYTRIFARLAWVFQSLPSFKKGTINIGDRQCGRLKAASVIDCEPDQISIRKALKQLYSSEFQKLLTTVENPYGKGGATERIVKILEGASVNDLLKKNFFDLN